MLFARSSPLLRLLRVRNALRRVRIKDNGRIRVHATTKGRGERGVRKRLLCHEQNVVVSRLNQLQEMVTLGNNHKSAHDHAVVEQRRYGTARLLAVHDRIRNHQNVARPRFQRLLWLLGDSSLLLCGLRPFRRRTPIRHHNSLSTRSRAFSRSLVMIIGKRINCGRIHR